MFTRSPRLLLVVLLAGVLGLAPTVGCTSAATAPVAGVGAAVPGEESGLPVRALSSLPDEASDTVALIRRGGPYPEERDGIVFENREGLLPDEARGHYREYTVPTPGSSDRGARRIVTGSSDEYYYTGDHYESFVVVDVTR